MSAGAPGAGSAAGAAGTGRFHRLWAAAAASNLADGVLAVALALATVRLTRSPVAAAGVALAARLPWLLLALHAGLVADRHDRRAVLLAGNGLRALLVAGLAVLVAAGGGRLGVLYVVAFGLGVAETLVDTTVHSAVPRLVARERLEWANGRMQAAELVMQQFLGPPLGGLLAGLGVALALAVGAGAYAASVVLLLALGPLAAAAPAARGSMWTDIGEGLRFLWRDALLRRLAGCGLGLNAAFAAVLATLPLYVIAPGPGGLSSASFGLLMTATGVGGLGAALSVEVVRNRLGTTRTLRVAIAALGLGFALPALSAHPAALAAGLALTGATTFYNIITVSLRQRRVPDHLLGRVSSGYRLFVYGGLPLGSAAAGLVGERLGLRVVFAGAALVVAGVALALLRGVRLAEPSPAEATLEAVHVPATAD